MSVGFDLAYGLIIQSASVYELSIGMSPIPIHGPGKLWGWPCASRDVDLPLHCNKAVPGRQRKSPEGDDGILHVHSGNRPDPGRLLLFSCRLSLSAFYCTLKRLWVPERIIAFLQTGLPLHQGPHLRIRPLNWQRLSAENCGIRFSHFACSSEFPNSYV